MSRCDFTWNFTVVPPGGFGARFDVHFTMSGENSSIGSCVVKTSVRRVYAYAEISARGVVPQIASDVT